MSEIDIYGDMGGAGDPDEDEEALFGTGLTATAATSSGNIGSNGNLLTSHGGSQSASSKGRAEIGGGSEWAGAVLPGSNAGTANALHSHRQQVHSRAQLGRGDGELPPGAGGRRCEQCGEIAVQDNPSEGNSTCMSCGHVQAENQTVSQVEFSEGAGGSSSVVGQFVSATSSRPFVGGMSMAGGGMAVGLGQQRDAHQVAVDKAKRVIQAFSGVLRLDAAHSEGALRIYIFALQKGFAKGRKTDPLLAACLYAACRRDQQPVQLLDFSDVSQVNVFALGRMYSGLVQATQLEVPRTDPALFMHRHAERLRLGEATYAVGTTAMRLAALFMRQWIVAGRRPSGVCAACLVIACRMHGLRVSAQFVARAVGIGEATLADRLAELQQSAVSLLPLDEWKQQQGGTGRGGAGTSGRGRVGQQATGGASDSGFGQETIKSLRKAAIASGLASTPAEAAAVVQATVNADPPSFVRARLREAAFVRARAVSASDGAKSTDASAGVFPPALPSTVPSGSSSSSSSSGTSPGIKKAISDSASPQSTDGANPTLTQAAERAQEHLQKIEAAAAAALRGSALLTPADVSFAGGMAGSEPEDAERQRQEVIARALGQPGGAARVSRALRRAVQASKHDDGEPQEDGLWRATASHMGGLAEAPGSASSASSVAGPLVSYSAEQGSPSAARLAAEEAAMRSTRRRAVDGGDTSDSGSEDEPISLLVDRVRQRKQRERRMLRLAQASHDGDVHIDPRVILEAERALRARLRASGSGATSAPPGAPHRGPSRGTGTSSSAAPTGLLRTLGLQPSEARRHRELGQYLRIAAGIASELHRDLRSKQRRTDRKPPGLSDAALGGWLAVAPRDGALAVQDVLDPRAATSQRTRARTTGSSSAHAASSVAPAPSGDRDQLALVPSNPEAAELAPSAGSIQEQWVPLNDEHRARANADVSFGAADAGRGGSQSIHPTASSRKGGTTANRAPDSIEPVGSGAGALEPAASASQPKAAVDVVIDDEELQALVLPVGESQRKRHMWDMLHGQFVKQRKRKRAAEAEHGKSRKKRKRGGQSGAGGPQELSTEELMAAVSGGRSASSSKVNSSVAQGLGDVDVGLGDGEDGLGFDENDGEGGDDDAMLAYA